jgi:hypothetical protein
LKSELLYGSADKNDWLKNHTLSKEQVKQLILNKYERAKKDQAKLDNLNKLVNFVD